MCCTNDVIRNYDLLIDEGNDPVHDPEPLQDYMNKWDGQDFINAMQLDKTKSVLEIGVGTGRLAVRVAPLCDKFCGIDISPKTVNKAKENLVQYSNVNLICGNFLTHSFLDQFDVIYSSLTFMHIKEKQDAIDKVFMLLKDGGRFILSIDKNQDECIDMGLRKIKIFPDDPLLIERNISKCRLNIVECFETELAYIHVAVKEV